MSESRALIESGKELTPEFPLRQFTKGDEPHANKSIGYFSKPNELFGALRNALYDEEWEDLKGSKLGVFIRFFEAEVSWASRVVHYMLGFQLVCKKKHEIWCLIGATPIRFSLNEFAHITGLSCENIVNLMSPEVEVTDEMTDYWLQLGVPSHAGPTYNQLLRACDRCDDWSTDDRKRLGYLCILAAFIDAKAHTSAIDLNLAMLVMDLERFENYPWGRVAFKKLITSVKDLDITGPSYHINGFAQALQAWVFYALPRFAVEFGQPTKSEDDIPLLAFGGIKGKRNFKPNMANQTKIVSYVEKDFGDMFPEWDDDGEKDEKVVNIVRAFYGHFKNPWVWRHMHWPREGVKASNNSVVVKQEAGQGVKRAADTTEEDSSTSKKARTEASFAEFEMRLTVSLTNALVSRLDSFERRVDQRFGEIGSKMDLLSSRVEWVYAKLAAFRGPDPEKNSITDSEKTKAGPTDGGSANAEDVPKVSPQAQETSVGSVDQAADGTASVVVINTTEAAGAAFEQKKREKQDLGEQAAAALDKAQRDKQKSPKPLVKTANPDPLGRGYDPFCSYKQHRRQHMTAFLDKCPEKGKREPKLQSSTWWYYKMRTEREWLWDTQMNAGLKLIRRRYIDHPEWFRSDRLCILDTFFSQLWRSSFIAFKDSNLPPPNAFDLFNGVGPEFRDKKWAIDIDELYAPINIDNQHWVAMHVSIKSGHITIIDSIVSCTSEEVLANAVEPFRVMIPNVINMLVPTDLKDKYLPVPYSWERLPAAEVPQNVQSGDCGVYTLKLIELHALGYPLNDKRLCDNGIKQIREKYAIDIFNDLKIKGTETEDNTGNLGVYEWR